MSEKKFKAMMLRIAKAAKGRSQRSAIVTCGKDTVHVGSESDY